MPPRAEGSSLRLTTDDGITLAATLVTVTAPKATVVICHGFTATRMDPNVLELNDVLAASGFSVLTYDARGHREPRRCRPRSRRPFHPGARSDAVARPGRPRSAARHRALHGSCVRAAGDPARRGCRRMGTGVAPQPGNRLADSFVPPRQA